MSTTTNYIGYVLAKLKKVQEEEELQIEAAAQLVCDSCMKGGRFYLFGSGHSHMIAEELYLRAGGLALVKGILLPELMLHEMPNKSTLIERLEGYASAMLSLHMVDEKDTLMVISNSGRNNVPVEMCLAAKEKGMKVIVLTSLAHSKASPSRHKSGKNIYELGDVVIDNHSEFGDAGYYVDQFDTPTGATSSITGTAIGQAIVVSAIEKMVAQGFVPPVFRSSNVDGADEYNQTLFDQYYGYVK